MDEFLVEVINVDEEVERLKEAAKAAQNNKDKGDEEGVEAPSGSIPCTTQVYVWRLSRDCTKPSQNNSDVLPSTHVDMHHAGRLVTWYIPVAFTIVDRAYL